MTLSDTAIFLIFLATLICALALIFFLRKFIPDCRETKRKAKVCETTKIDKDDYKKRKFDLDLECGRSLDSGEKEKSSGVWWRSLESLGRKDSKAGRGADRQVGGGEETKGASSSTGSTGLGGLTPNESEQRAIENEIDDAHYTHVTSALEGVSPKTLEHDQEFDDIALGSTQCNNMLDGWQGKKW